MREISDSAGLAAAAHGDTLCAWAAQGLDGRSRAWRSDDGRAVAVAGPALATRDRLVIAGAPDAAAPLLALVLARVGPASRPLGEAALIDALADRIPGLARVGRFGWMDYVPPGPAVDRGLAEWLPEADLALVADLLAASYPASYAQPGAPGVERWAGARGGQGLGWQVCRFLLAEALARHGAAALMVDEANQVARRLYQGLGLRYRALGVAAMS